MLLNLSFTKRQTTIIKGFAIIIIVLHNFIHLTNPIGENEMLFDSNRIFVFLHTIKNDPLMIVNSIISYFGFYALELFIFISGYGLAIKCKNFNIVKCYKNILGHIVKLYSLLIFGILIYIIIFYSDYNLKWFINFAIKTLSMTNNFSFNKLFEVVGPWWYFSLALQLYLLFPLLFALLKRHGKTAFFLTLIVCYTLIYILKPFADKYNFPIFGNAIGHLPEFLLGIGLVLFPTIKYIKAIMGISLIIFILSNFYEAIFPLSFLSATILLLFIMCFLLNTLPHKIDNIFYSIGCISMFIFLINGPLRIFTLSTWGSGSPLFILLGSFIHLVFVILISYLLSFIYKYTFNIISQKIICLIKKI